MGYIPVGNSGGGGGGSIDPTKSYSNAIDYVNLGDRDAIPVRSRAVSEKVLQNQTAPKNGGIRNTNFFDVNEGFAGNGGFSVRAAVVGGGVWKFEIGIQWSFDGTNVAIVEPLWNNMTPVAGEPAGDVSAAVIRYLFGAKGIGAAFYRLYVKNLDTASDKNFDVFMTRW